MYPVCDSCKKEHFNIDNVFKMKRCGICGKVLISTDGICLQCRESDVIRSGDFVLPMFSYRLWNKELLFLWKIKGCRCLSVLFAELYAMALRKLEVDVIVPVPPRPGKIRKTGWDQINEVCKILKYRFGFRIFEILGRYSSEQQKKLNRNERLATIGKSYYIKKGIERNKILKSFHDTFPGNLCIIDDVCTTGSTLESCAKLLKSEGVEKIFILSLFVVD